MGQPGRLSHAREQDHRLFPHIQMPDLRMADRGDIYWTQDELASDHGRRRLVILQRVPCSDPECGEMSDCLKESEAVAKFSCDWVI